MNKLLADALGMLNALVGILLVICAIGGGFLANGLFGALAGLFAGTVFAVLACGMIAIFVDMRQEIIATNRLLERFAFAEEPVSAPVPAVTASKQDMEPPPPASSRAPTDPVSGMRERYRNADLFNIQDGLIFALKDPTQFMVFRENALTAYSSIDDMETASPSCKTREAIAGAARATILAQFEDYMLAQMIKASAPVT